jgi:predicted nucleic acid-binding protein
LSSEAAAPHERHDPAKYTLSFAYRDRAQLPYDIGALAPDASLMLDTTVYIDAQKGKLPAGLAARIGGATITHCAVALSELATSIGILDPNHSGTPAVRSVLSETLSRASPERTVAPSAEAWVEAALMSGILARTQGLPKEDRRKLLNDALIFLCAGETGAVLVSANKKDIDLLLRLKPAVQVLLYDAA